MISADVVATLGVWRLFVYFMEPFQPLAYDPSCQWLKFPRIENGGVVGVGDQEVPTGNDDMAMLSIFELIFRHQIASFTLPRLFILSNEAT